MSKLSPYSVKFDQLTELLLQFQTLWRPNPLLETNPDWCEKYTQLAAECRQLQDSEVASLEQDNEALAQWLGKFLPQVYALQNLTYVPPLRRHDHTYCPVPARFASGIPGRKWEQVQAFASVVSSAGAPVVDWCGGKGHLGRLLGSQWQLPVQTIELDGKLCAAGAALAKRHHVEHTFVRGDACQTQWVPTLRGNHAVALHACGDLHRSLLRQAVVGECKAIDLAPCCYHVAVDAHYYGLSGESPLTLRREELRLAVLEPATCSTREIHKRDRTIAWKLAYGTLSEQQLGNRIYPALRAGEKHWLGDNFADFCRRIARRESVELPTKLPWDHYEQDGWKRQRVAARLSLVRLAFRRALECWLVLDLARYLELNGYCVDVGVFCSRAISPRNILVHAER